MGKRLIGMRRQSLQDYEWSLVTERLFAAGLSPQETNDMKVPPKTTGGDFVVPDPGVYRMEFKDYDDPVISTFKKKDGSDQYRVKLVFVIKDEESEFDGIEIFAWYGWSMYETSKLYPVVKALLGREIEEDEEPDLDDLIGKNIMGTLDNKTVTKDGVERTYANLVAVSPIRKKKDVAAKPARASKPPVERDEEEELWDDSESAA